MEDEVLEEILVGAEVKPRMVLLPTKSERRKGVKREDGLEASCKFDYGRKL